MLYPRPPCAQGFHKSFLSQRNMTVCPRPRSADTELMHTHTHVHTLISDSIRQLELEIPVSSPHQRRPPCPATEPPTALGPPLSSQTPLLETHWTQLLPGLPPPARDTAHQGQWSQALAFRLPPGGGPRHLRTSKTPTSGSHPQPCGQAPEASTQGVHA